MIYIKNIFITVLLFFFSLYKINGQYNDLDSIYSLKITPFLSKIIAINDFDGNIKLSNPNKLIPTEGTIFSTNAQEIIKNNQQFLVNIQQTGFLYQFQGLQDSLAVFKRIDNTLNINYNIGALLFFNDKQLYSYGGYGFWKANGHIRKFNTIDKEWDIIPTNDEIISSYFVYYSKQQHKIYAPLQRLINAGIEGGGSYKNRERYESYVFDFKQKQWQQIGMMTKKLKKVIARDNNLESPLPIQNGLLTIIEDEIWFLDYINNKVYKSQKTELNQYFIRKPFLYDMFYHKDSIFTYNDATEKFSVVHFNLSDFTDMQFAIWGRDTSKDIYIALAFFIFLFFVLLLRWIRRRERRRMEKSRLKVLKTDNIHQAFVGVEISLIELLISCAAQKKNADIFQINHVLGIKDKNIGLQKKVRSDMINSINEKYQFITNRAHQLISSVRKEDDKRFFEYYIAPSELTTIKKIIEHE